MKLFIALTVLLATTCGEYSQRYRGRPPLNNHSYQGNSLINLLTGQKFDNSPYRTGYLHNPINYGYQNRPLNGNSGLSALASQYLKNSKLKQSLQYKDESGWANKHLEKGWNSRFPQDNVGSNSIPRDYVWGKRALQSNIWKNEAEIDSSWNNKNNLKHPFENEWSNEVSSIWNNRAPTFDVSNQQTVSYIQAPIAISNQEPIIHKHVYVHVAPPDDEPPPPPKPIILPPPNKTYKIIFVKVPSLTPPPAPIPVLAPPNEEKTLVYVLVKKPESQQQVIIPQPVVEQSKPEVYFIKYKPKNPENQQSVVSLGSLGSLGGQNPVGLTSSIGAVNLNGNFDTGLLRNSPLVSGSSLLHNGISDAQLSQNAVSSVSVTLNDAHYDVQSHHISSNSKNTPILYGSHENNNLAPDQGAPVEEYNDESQDEAQGLSNNFYPQDNQSQEYEQEFSVGSSVSPNSQSYFRSARDSPEQTKEELTQ